MAPRATYRFQFHKDFTFDSAVALVPYLARLGVSHLYASPFFQAHPGSTHGYDVVDYGTLNPELGGAPAFARLSEALKTHGLKLLLDFVPNHMGVGGADNAAWLDLLEWGQEADHAGWFDVDWSTDRTDIRGKVLVPFLGGQYGVVLKAGQIELRFDEADGAFAVWAHGTHKLPVCPLHYETILGQGTRELAALGDEFADVMRWRPQIMRRVRALKDRLAELAADPDQRAALDAQVARFAGQEGDLASWSRLSDLIARQNWKPTHYQVASDDINYRRFFNIATLAGLRMELPDVFDHAHGLVFRMMADGLLDGLRIDHVDGLFDPQGYLDRLRREAPESCRDDFYLVVEKILGPDEALRGSWPVQGTTGYDFTNLLTSLFVDNENEDSFSRLYREFTGEARPFETIIFDSKVQIIDNEMLSELHRLARGATRVARQNPLTADFTLTSIQRALRLLVASFPVYRTYITGRQEASPEDRAELDRALRSARQIDRAIDPSLFDFLRDLLTGDLAMAPDTGYRRSDVLRDAMKFQQYCGPVMAKGVEDTAFYRYYRFVALNEVGGSPDRFGISVRHFHDANAVRAEHWPDAMLATSTHDTKRGEDTRARLVALSSMPGAWERAVRDWAELLGLAAGPEAQPDRNDAYLLFQLLVGTWPAAFVSDGPLEAQPLADYIERLKGAMTKSMREAKRHSTWTTPDEPYETATLGLIDRALTGDASAGFLAAFRPFANEVAARGAANTFAQTVLKFTVPGMPDIYQGAEGWDLSMVDPDNRRPVDFAIREASLADLGGQSVRSRWAAWQDGGFKLALTRVLLRLRQEHPELLSRGDYSAVEVQGPRAADFCAFTRTAGDVTLLVVARRLQDDANLPGVTLDLPAALEGKTAEDVLTSGTATLSSRFDLVHALDGLPAAVWLIRP